MLANALDWIQWKFGYGWSKTLFWIGGGPDPRVESGLEILWEEHWRNRKTGELRIVRGVRHRPDLPFDHVHLERAAQPNALN